MHYGGAQWKCILEVQSRFKQYRFTVELNSGDVQWMFTVEVYSGCSQWRCTVYVYSGGAQWTLYNVSGPPGKFSDTLEIFHKSEKFPVTLECFQLL